MPFCLFKMNQTENYSALRPRLTQNIQIIHLFSTFYHHRNAAAPFLQTNQRVSFPINQKSESQSRSCKSAVHLVNIKASSGRSLFA